MKKAFILIFITIVTLVLSFVACADTYLEYGDSVYQMPMNGTLDDSTYWYFLRGEEACEISSEEAYEGKTSLKCDLDILNTIDNAVPLNLHTSYISNTNGIDESDMYFEFYTYGCEDLKDRMNYCVYFTDGGMGSNILAKYNSNYKSEETEKDGWYRKSYTVSLDDVGSFPNVHMELRYDKDLSKSGIFYIDNINMRVIPVSISAEDVITKDKTLDLSALRVFGFNRKGTSKLITNTHMINWSVTQGNAQIIGDKLFFNDLSAENTVTVEADFYGKKCIFNVTYVPTVIYSQPVLENDTVKINITNDSDSSVSTCVYILLYDGDKIFTVDTLNETISSMQTKELKQGIIIPSIVKNPKLKVMYYDSFGGIYKMLEIKD